MGGRAHNRDEHRLSIIQLLRDRANAFTSGASLKDFAEMGPPGNERMVFNAEYVRRTFGVPRDPKNPDSEYVEHLRGASHAVLEIRLSELAEISPAMHRAVVTAFPADEGGDRDYEYYKQNPQAALYAAWADEKGPWRHGFDFLVELGINDLSEISRAAGDELFVIFSRARTIREEKRLELKNEEIDAYYRDWMARGKSEYTAALNTSVAYGISQGHVRRIAESQRLSRGEEKRGRGRPAKGEPKKREKGVS